MLCVFRSRRGGYIFKILTVLLAIFCFVDSQIYICDFHREQAWERWLAKSSNGLTDRKQSVLAKLRAVARARTEEEYLEKLDDLKNSEEWKTNSNLSNYMTKTWLPQHKVHLHKHFCSNSLCQKLISFFPYRNGYGRLGKTGYLQQLTPTMVWRGRTRASSTHTWRDINRQP